AIFRGVEKLLSAHYLVVASDDWNRSPQRYWQLNMATDERPSVAEWQERVRAKVNESVRAHMIADVPVGAFLSGGVDSTVIVSCGTSATPTQIQTFSLGFREEAF